MVDVTQPVTMIFIAQTIGAIVVVIALGIMMVKQAKKKKESV
jgi:NADH:ubiquinone oxidoreductase subunit 6 (subunit J)